MTSAGEKLGPGILQKSRTRSKSLQQLQTPKSQICINEPDFPTTDTAAADTFVVCPKDMAINFDGVRPACVPRARFVTSHAFGGACCDSIKKDLRRTIP